jgi:hypothetical protein
MPEGSQGPLFFHGSLDTFHCLFGHETAAHRKKTVADEEEDLVSRDIPEGFDEGAHPGIGVSETGLGASSYEATRA